MKTISAGDLKTHFSEILKSVEAGEKFAITYGKKKEIKALLVPNEIKKTKRKLGILEGKATYAFVGGHNTSEKEFFGL
ncbi:MAG: hypothetical protein ABI707_17780 [Ferruginibacter sp.]